MDLVSIKSNQFSSVSEIFASELVIWKEGKAVSFSCLSNVDRSILSTRFANTFPLIYLYFATTNEGK